MKLTRSGYQARPECERRIVGGRLYLLREHPATGRAVIEYVEIVERVHVPDCEHDMTTVVRAGVFDGKYLARCMDCGIGGPVVATEAEAVPALVAAHPRASFREARDERGVWGWTELVGAAWLAFSCAGADEHGVCIGRYGDPEAAVASVLERWAPRLAVQHG